MFTGNGKHKHVNEDEHHIRADRMLAALNKLPEAAKLSRRIEAAFTPQVNPLAPQAAALIATSIVNAAERMIGTRLAHSEDIVKDARLARREVIDAVTEALDAWVAEAEQIHREDQEWSEQERKRYHAVSEYVAAGHYRCQVYAADSEEARRRYDGESHRTDPAAAGLGAVASALTEGVPNENVGVGDNGGSSS